MMFHELHNEIEKLAQPIIDLIRANRALAEHVVIINGASMCLRYSVIVNEHEKIRELRQLLIACDSMDEAQLIQLKLDYLTKTPEYA